MSDRATCWSLTINNPTKSDDEWIAQAQQKKGWKVYGQREKGAEGTEHYQLMLTTPQIRFAAVKKAFPRAHIEAARDRTALLKYVQKADTKVADLPQSTNYPTYGKIMEWYGQYYDQWAEANNGIEKHQWLYVFDYMIDRKIREGYFCESYAMNPQVRGSIQKFGSSIAFRERERRQTDRQTTEINIPDIGINNAAQDEEYNEEVNEESSGETLSHTSSCSSLST